MVIKKKYEFNAKKETAAIIDWIREYFAENGPGHNAIIGISGGKDSTVVAALCARALGRDRVYGVCMPQGVQSDLGTAKEVIYELGINDLGEINIGKTCDALYSAIGRIDCEENPVVTSNTPARIRMATLYAIAAMYNGRVACTCNASEDYVGYSTKWGDAAGDFAVLEDYTVTEILAIGEVLGIPNRFLYKTPEDGLSGKSDEENLGFSYKELDQYIREGIVLEIEVLENIRTRHERNKHKTLALRLPYPRRGEWRHKEEYSEGWAF